MNLTATDLRIVNAKVNLLPYKADAETFGTPEFWERVCDAEAGDCEDYALEKYHRLLLIGAKPEQMRFATCFVEPAAAAEKKDRYHCVLLFDLDGTTYVLDNRYPHPMEHNFLPYEWHKLQIAGTQQWEWAQDADRGIA